MYIKRDNFKAAKNRILFSPQCFLIRHYLKNNRPNFLKKITDKQKLEEIRKTISEIEVVFLNPQPADKIEDDKNKDYSRYIDLERLLPKYAKKFINYRKEQE